MGALLSIGAAPVNNRPDLRSYVPEKFKDKNLDQATYVVEMNGRRAFGYNGEDIVDICKMYLDARKAGNVLLPNQIQLRLS